MLSLAAINAVLAQSQGDPRYWAIRWQYAPGNAFFDKLLQAAAHADPDNLGKIAAEWPAIGHAVWRWKNSPGWAQEVEVWAESLALNALPSELAEGCEPPDPWQDAP